MYYKMRNMLNDKYLIAVILLGIPLSLYGYLDGFTHPFRSDGYFFLNKFNHLPFNFDSLHSVLTLQPAGHKRFDTFGFLFAYLQFKALGCNHVLHHLFQFLMHLGNAALLYIFASRILQNRLLACISAILFLSFYSHFNLINWTCSPWIPFSSILILSGLISISKYLDTQKLGYIYLSTILLFSSLFFYEANMSIPLLAIPLFIILIRQRNVTSISQDKGFIIFTIIIVSGYILYLAYIYLSAHTGTSTVTISQIISLSNLLKAGKETARAIMDVIFLKNFGFPSQLEIRDIVYMQPVTFIPTSPVFILALLSLIVVASSIRTDRNALKLAALLFIMLGSYIFLVAVGRTLSAPEGYLASQSRYFYVPNMFFAIFLLLLIKERAASFTLSNLPLFVALSIIIILNVLTVRSHTLTVSEKLSPLSTYISSIKDFYSTHKQEGDFKLFVDFPVSQENGTFNWGADIALDVYFYRTKILTKNIYRAKYIYTKEGTFQENPLFGSPHSANLDFTIEFVYTQVRPSIPEDFAVIGRLDGEWCFRFTSGGRALFEADFTKDGEVIHKIFDPGITIPVDYPIHFVIQKQGDKLYLLVDGEILCLDNLDGYTMNVDKSISYIMGGPYYLEKVFALPGKLFVSIGKPYYDLKDKKLGDFCPQVPVLERKANLNIDPEEKKKRELLNRPHWILVDFGHKPRVINKIKVRPRTNNARQFWKVATLKGSNDGIIFENIGPLDVQHVPPENEWLSWTFKDCNPYRFYMIWITSGHSGGRFFSCSELILTEDLQGLTPPDIPEYTSSPHLDDGPPSHLKDGNVDTYWHATYYTQHVTDDQEVPNQTDDQEGQNQMEGRF